MIKSPSGQVLRCLRVAVLVAALTPVSTSTWAGDVAAGSNVFKTECSECHSTKEGRNKKGPSLFNVVGRKAGTLPDYEYSDALKHADWVWAAEKLQSYLSQPAKKANPGTKMKYGGLDDAKQREDLLSYLASQH